MQRIYMTVFVLIASVALGLAKAQDRVVDAPASNREVPKPFRFLIEGSIADLNQESIDSTAKSVVRKRR